MGAWLEAWTQAVGLENFALLGHSMGGYVCMSLAARAEVEGGAHAPVGLGQK